MQRAHVAAQRRRTLARWHLLVERDEVLIIPEPASSTDAGFARDENLAAGAEDESIG
jgi:hypothetical protein